MLNVSAATEELEMIEGYVGPFKLIGLSRNIES
jgi:hypothetical protein